MFNIHYVISVTEKLKCKSTKNFFQKYMYFCRLKLIICER